ncbi:hypothetical protein CF327_g2721 [Tilletia walkeri]|uniref:1-alkyl-2-acetylglycerophosphocholine esterase n=1 Tax=Tilletia walkeri TaxID=117179 RepID=A0A8X7T1X8_9BASI|nr:hypothetical protein CF327_g2721 [Tilletia walkeri]KAE8265887.1 hypothetical protein A4X09_0g6460 [Tilletia walkeri]
MPLKRAKNHYAVSTITLELPARKPRAFQPDHYKINGQPAFHLTTILVTIFYPTDRRPQAASSKLKPKSTGENIKSTAADAATDSSGEDQPNTSTPPSVHGNGSASPKTQVSQKRVKKEKKPRPLHWLNTPRLRSIEGLLKFAGLPKWTALPVILPAFQAFQARLPYENSAPLSTKVPPQDSEEAQDSPLAQLLRAQLLEHRDTDDDFQPTFPCAIFSHGLGGTRVTYSAYCAALASHGVVVAAIEHRDGTAPATSICSLLDQDGDNQAADGSADASAEGSAERQARYREDSLIWLSMKDLDPDEKVNPEDFLTARKAQLLLRRAEFIEALSVLKRLNDGEGTKLERQCLRTHYAKKTVGATPISKDRDSSNGKRVLQSQKGGRIVEVGSETPLHLETWKGRLDIENAWALGHSFGAATAIEVMRCASTPPSLELDPAQIEGQSAADGRPEEQTTLLHPTHEEVVEAEAFKHALVLDPWTEPIEGPGKAQTLTRPLFCINSEAFSIWRKNFDPLRRLMEEAAQHNREKEGWLLTLTKTRHTDFSDFPFVLKTLFGSDVNGKECIRVFAGLTVLQIAARASTSKLSSTNPGPVGGEQAHEGLGNGATSTEADVVLASLPPASQATARHLGQNDDGPYASFWAGVDALMNSNGNERYGVEDIKKSKYQGSSRTTRMRVEWEGETEQERFGRPLSEEDYAAAKATAKKKDAGLKYGNERPGILVAHPLGTVGSCPRALIGHGLNGAATATEDAAEKLFIAERASTNGPASLGTPVRKLSGSIRAPKLSLSKERQLSQADRTPRRKASRVEP